MAVVWLEKIGCKNIDFLPWAGGGSEPPTVSTAEAGLGWDLSFSTITPIYSVGGFYGFHLNLNDRQWLGVGS